MDIRKELQIRARVEAVFNKREDDFPSKAEYDDYLEEREDIIFNLTEGSNVAEMEKRIDAYRLANAESIALNEARKAERARRRAAAEAEAGMPALDRADVSGTAAAFRGGQDAEPHQGMEYVASLPAGAVMGVAPLPMGPLGADGDVKPAAAQGQQTREQWRLMALASGWTPELPKKKALDEVFGSLLVNCVPERSELRGT